MALDIYVRDDYDRKTNFVTSYGDSLGGVPMTYFVQTAGVDVIGEGTQIGSIVINETTGASTTLIDIQFTNYLVLDSQIISNSTDIYSVQVSSEYAEDRYSKLDLYDDEPIEVTENIKDFKDVAKVLSDSSQQFKVPASKINNGIFENYYNNDIVDGFDARFRRDCILKLNGIDWKNGAIRLSGVGMKSNSPEFYNITFFGNTASLKSIIGDDDLSDIEELNAFTHNYSYGNVRKYAAIGANLSYTGDIATGITDASTNFYEHPDMAYPFISASDRYFVDTNEGTPDIAKNRNLYTSNPATVDNYTGLLYTDLKPAIKVIRVMEMIGRKYGFTFSKDFLNDDSRTVMDSLYLWCSRESGRITNLIDTSFANILTSNFSLSSGTEIRVNGNTEFYSRSVKRFNKVLINKATARFKITPNDLNGNYSILIKDEVTGGSYFVLENAQGVVEVSFEMPAGGGAFGAERYHKPKITISTKGAITSAVLSDVVFEQIDNISSPNTIETGNYADYNVSGLSSDIDFNIISTPKIKTMDFIRNFMKMFNLVMYVKDDELVLEPLDWYMKKGTTHDITKYCDFSSHNINRGDIYKEINFEYKEPKTVFAIQSNEATGDEYGNERFKSNELTYFDGGKYDVKVGASHMLYEKFVDEGGEFSFPVWGYSVSDSFSSVNVDSLFFFASKGGFNTGSGSLFYMTDGVTNNTTTGNRIFSASNSYYDFNKGNLASINFGSEYSSGGEQVVDNSLFSMYYQNYIQNIYNAQSRVLKINANLPMALTLGINLNDSLIIGSDRYIINSIKKNMNTGVSDLTLLIDNYTGNIQDLNLINGVLDDGSPIELRSYEWLVSAFTINNNVCSLDTNVGQSIFISDNDIVYAYNSYGQYYFPLTGGNRQYKIAGYEYDVIELDSLGNIIDKFDCP